jgi:hypothetical protein
VQPTKDKELSALLATGSMACVMRVEIQRSTFYADQSNYCWAVAFKRRAYSLNSGQYSMGAE